MRWNDRTIVMVSLLIAVLISWPISYAGFFVRAENWVGDYIQIIWGDRADFDDIVIIDIDETSMRALNSQLGAWPYDRQVYAASIEYLRQMGADKIVFDILFSDIRGGDEDLARELSADNDIYLASILLHDYRFVDNAGSQLLDRHDWKVEQPPLLKQKGLIMPQPDFMKRANTGVISVFPDEDGVLRRMPLVFNVEEKYLPAMMLSLMSDQRNKTIDFDWTKVTARHAGNTWPVNDKGAVVLKYPVNFTDIPVIPFYKFLISAYDSVDSPVDTYRGKTIFIGSSASILGDYAYIPGQGRVHGLGVLALAYHSLKHGSVLRTDSLLINILVALLFFFIMAATVRFSGVRPVLLLSAYGVCVVSGFLLVVMLYRYHNMQAWLLFPTLASTLFVIFSIIAKSLSLQLEGQRLKFEKQAAEDARDLKAKFLAYMTHELRTPLTAIMGYNKLLLDEKVEQAEQKNYLQVIEENSEHLLNLINNILDQSRIEADQLKLIKNEHNIHGLLNDVKLLMQPLADSKGIQIRLNIPDCVPQVLVIDRTRVKQILINLVGNALKFIEQGYVLLETDWRNDMLTVSVQDTGPGIPEDNLRSIFESFQQVDSVIASETTGSGLGLTISTNLARLMGGRIDVTSELDVGTTFTLMIEAQAGVSVKQDVEDDMPPMMTPGGSGYILLAEDSKDSSALITLYLEMAGYQVKWAINGRQAVEMSAEDPPGMILMDMNMPLMDGEAATREIRESGYTGPIVSLTASTDESVIAGMREAGSNGEVAKPVDVDSLVQTVSRYLAS